VSEQTPGRRAGRVMWVLAWGAGLLLATHFFGGWEDRQRNPNQMPRSVHGDGFVEVSLASSRQGHYVVDGQIDGQKVTFLLDTGATQVAIPSQVARDLGLQAARQYKSAPPTASPRHTVRAWTACAWAISSCVTSQR